MKFRVFLSSTFAEFHDLRNRLKDGVLAELQRYCQERGAAFEAVDLRWGVTRDVASAQRTVRVCLSEVDRCTALGVKPCFILLIGNRSGTRPLPHTLSEGDFAALLSACDAPEDRALIQRWYRLDRNNVPPQAGLLERAGVSDAEWAASERALLAVIDRAARRADLAQVLAQTATVTLQELRQAVAAMGEGAVSIVAVRNDPVEAEDAFLEVLLAEADAASGQRVIRFDNNADGVQALEQALLARIKSEVDEALVADRAITASEREARDHDQFARDLLASMVGREALVADILARQASLLLITGAGGIGKSAVMAAAAKRASEAADTTVVQRFVGATPASLNLSSLISGMADELVERAGDRAALDERLHDTEFERLRRTVATVSPATRIRFFIDGLDQLELDPRSALWDGLGDDWPANVQFVISAAHGPTADQLAQRTCHGEVIETPGLAPADQIAAIAQRLERFGRRLQPAQYSQLQARLVATATPLVLRLLSEALREVRSFDAIDESLELSMESVLQHLLQRLRVDGHGEALISASLGLLAVARQGLTEPELRQLLFRDEATRAEFVALHPNSPSTDELPGVIWARLRNQLDYLLRETDAPSGRLLTFFHRVVKEAVERLALSGFGLTRRAGQLADFFAEQAHDGRTPNKRKLMELPAALQRAGRNQALHDLLSDRGFVLAKCRLNQSDDLIGDFGRLAGERTGRLAAIEDLLRRSAHLLRRGRPAWPADGILIQVALERPPEDPARRVFEPVSALGQAQALWLRRTWPGSGGARSVLEGHEDEVLGFIAADEDRGLTWSADGTIRLWGLRDGDCRRVLSAPGRQAEDVWLVDAAVIFAWSEAGIAAWDMRSGRPLVDTPAPEGRAWLAAARWRDQAVLLAEDGSLHAAPLNPPGPAEAIAPPAEGAAASAGSGAEVVGVALSITEGGEAVVVRNGRFSAVRLDRLETRWDSDLIVARHAPLPNGCLLAGLDGALVAWDGDSGLREIRPAPSQDEGRPRPWRLIRCDHGAVALEARPLAGRTEKAAILAFDDQARLVGQGTAGSAREGDMAVERWTGAARHLAETAAQGLNDEDMRAPNRAAKSPRKVFDGAVARGSQVYVGDTDGDEDQPPEHLSQCSDLAGLRLLADGQAVAYRRAETNDPGLYVFDARSGALTRRLQGQQARIQKGGQTVFEDPVLNQMGPLGSAPLARINGILLQNELVATWGFGSAVHLWDTLRETPIATLAVANTVEIFSAVLLEGAPLQRPDQIVVMTSRGVLVAYEPVRNQARALQTGASTNDYARRYEQWGLRNIGGGLAWFFRNYPIHFWSRDQIFSDSDTKTPRLFHYAGHDPEQGRRILSASARPDAQVRDLVDLSDSLFAALQANEVIEVFPIDGRQAQARFSGAGLSRLADGDYVSWSPSRGVRRWTRAPNTDGPDLVMAWGAPPPERAALEGAEILEDRGYLTWASDRRFRLYHLQTGEMLLETPQLEAIFNHPDFIALQARSARDGRSSALEWTAWTSDRVLGLSSTKAGGPTVLWHGDERITVCDISEDGLVAALTESGRPLILQLHQGDDAIELPAPLATGALPRTSARSQEPLFHRLRERQKLLFMLGAPAEAEQVKARIRNNLESLAPESRLGVQLRMISEVMSAGDWRGAAAQSRALAQSTDHADARLALDICARVAHWALGEGRLAQADLPSDPDALKRFIEHLVLINRNFAEPKVSRACQVLTEAATRSLTDDPTMLALRLVAIEDILSWAPPSWGMRLNAWLSMRLLQTEPERETWRLRLALAAAANPANPQKSARSLGRSLAAMTRQWPARDGDPVLLARAAHAVIRAARGEPPPTDLRRRADAVIALLPRTRVDGPLITVMSALGRLSLPSDAATDREGTLAALHRAFADIMRATADESLRVSALVGLAEAACRLADSRIQAVQDTSSLSHLDDTLAMIAESLDAGSPLALELSGGLLARRAVLGPAEAAAATLRTAELAAWRSNKPALNLALILEAARALARRDRWPQAERLVGDWLAAVVQTCRMTPPVSEHQARHVAQVFDLAIRTAADLNHPGAVSRWALRAVRDTATAHAADGDLISVAVAEAVLQSGPTDTPETVEVMRHGIAGFGALGGVNSAPAMTAFVERLASTRPELLRACTGDILERLGRWAPRLADAGAKEHWAGRLREALRPHLDQITVPSDAQAAGLKFLRLQ